MTRFALLVFNEAPPLSGTKMEGLDSKLLDTINRKLKRILECEHEEYDKFKVEPIIVMTRDDAREKIENFFSGKKEKDLLLFYYIGHGIQHEEGQPLRFLFKDSFRRKSKDKTVYSPDINFDKTIAHTDIESEIRKSTAKKIIIILDCCCSGVAIKQIKIEDPTKKVLIISSVTEASLAVIHKDREIKGGAFSLGFMEGIESGEAALGLTGRITLGNAFSYAKKYVKEKYPFQEPRTYGDPELADELIYFVTDSFLEGRLYKMNPSSVYSKIGKLLELIQDNPQKNAGELHSIIAKKRPKEFLVPVKKEGAEVQYNIISLSTFEKHLQKCREFGLVTDTTSIELNKLGKNMFENNCKRYNFYLRKGLLKYLKQYDITAVNIVDKISELIKKGESSAVRPLWESFILDGKRIGFYDFRYVIKLLSVIRVIRYTNRRYYLPSKRGLVKL